MTDTLLSSVSSLVMSEILSPGYLKPLRSRFVLLPYLNASSIDGVAAEDRKIPKMNEIAEAVDDSEGTSFQEYAEFNDDTPITLTPTSKIQGVKPSVKSLRRAMPGATRAEVIAAIQSRNPAALPMLAAIAEEILVAHYKAAERAALALFTGASQSAGTTNEPLEFFKLIDAQTTMFETNKPEHRTLAAFIGARGIGQLRTELVNGNTAGAGLFRTNFGDEFLNSIGGPANAAGTPFGNILGMPIFEADSALMPDANGTTDKVGAVVAIGRGETTAPGSTRGFAEFCEGHSLDVDLEYDLEGDVAKAIGRYEWDVKEHTDQHIVKVLYKAAA